MIEHFFYKALVVCWLIISLGFIAKSQNISHFDLSYSAVHNSETFLGGGAQIWLPASEKKQLSSGFIQVQKQTGKPGQLYFEIAAQIAPNPTSESLNILLASEPDFPIVTEIIDIYGRLLATKTQTEIYGKLDVSGLSGGIYFLRLTQPETNRYAVLRFTII